MALVPILKEDVEPPKLLWKLSDWGQSLEFHFLFSML